MGKLITADITAIAQPSVVRIAHEFDGWPPYRNVPPPNDPDAQVPLAQVQKSDGTAVTSGYPDPTFVGPLDRVQALTGEVITTGRCNLAGSPRDLVDTTNTFANVKTGDLVRNVTKRSNLVEVITPSGGGLVTVGLNDGNSSWDLHDEYRVYKAGSVGPPTKVVEFARDRTNRLRSVINHISRIALLIAERFIDVAGATKMASNVDMAGKEVTSGLCSTGGTSTSLVDLSAKFTATVAVGDVARHFVPNADGVFFLDGNSVLVTVVTDTVITTEALTSGTNLWALGDRYTISNRKQIVNLATPVDAGDLITKADLDVQTAIAATVSTGSATVVQTDGSKKMTAALKMGAKKIINHDVSEADTDIKVTRGIGSFTSTDTFIDITVPAIVDVSKALLRITSVTLGGTQPPIAVTALSQIVCRCEIVGSTTIRFTRDSSPTDITDVYWEMWEYTGAVGGVNEFIVRRTSTVSIGSGILTASEDFPPGVVDSGDLVPFLMGIETPYAGSVQARVAFTIEAVIATRTVDLIRRASGSTPVIVGYVLIEFTGSNWKVQTMRGIPTGVASEVTLTNQIAAWDETIIQWSYAHDDKGASQQAFHFGSLVTPVGSGNLPARQAIGEVKFASQVNDADSVTLIDTGLRTDTFEFDNDGSVLVGNILVSIGVDKDETALNLATAIRASRLRIQARIGDGDTVTLTQTDFGSAGNSTITEFPVSNPRLDITDFAGGADVPNPPTTDRVQIYGTLTDSDLIAYIIENPGFHVIHGSASIIIGPATTLAALPFQEITATARTGVISGLVDVITETPPRNPPEGYWSYRLFTRDIIQYATSYSATPRALVFSWQVAEFPIKTTNTVSLSHLKAVRVVTEQTRFSRDGGAALDGNLPMGGNLLTGIVESSIDPSTDLHIVSKGGLVPLLDHFTDESLTTDPLSTRIPVGAVLTLAYRSRTQTVGIGALPTIKFPTNYLLCDGSEKVILDFPKLAALLGDTWGSPSSSLKFVLPDLRGRVAMGLDNGTGRIKDGFADTLGGTGGVEDHALTESEIGEHLHVYADNIAGIGNSTGSVNTANVGPLRTADNADATKRITHDDRHPKDVSTRFPRGNPPTVDWGTAHSNLQPSIAVLYVVRAK